MGGMATETLKGDLSHNLYPPNFGNFIFEFLNRLVMFSMLGLIDKLPVVIYDCLPKRWDGFLELMGVSKDQIIRIPIIESPAFRKVWISSACHYRDSHGTFRYWAEGLMWFRSRMFSAIGGPKVQARRRLYLGRSDALWRKIANENEIVQLLETYGFECPVMKDLTAHEQVELMSGAEIVVFAAGAGSVMIQLAPDQCIHIFLVPEGIAHGPYGGLGGAAVLRQVFERIDTDPVEGENFEKLNAKGISIISDHVVDIETLRTKLDRAIKLIDRTHHRDALLL